MPLIEIRKSDLKGLIGKKITDEQLKEVMPLCKMNIDDWSENNIRVEMTADRPDLFSVEGMARQIRAWLGYDTGIINYSPTKSGVSINSEKVTLRPFITCGIVRNLVLSDDLVRSLIQLQETLDLTLGRDRKKAAIGLHDISQVKPPFTYKEVDPHSVEFIPLEGYEKMDMKEILLNHPKGVKYRHLVEYAKAWPVIVDADNKVLSFPPIINGELTKVRPDTKDMFFEITGSDQRTIDYMLNILTTALAERGAEIEQVKVNGKWKPDLTPNQMKLDTDTAKSLLGLDLKFTDVKTLLERMNYSILGAISKDMSVLVPPYRYDVLHPSDITEDIAIAYGYNNFTPEMPRHASSGRFLPEEESVNRIRELMIGSGFQEVINYTLTSKDKQFAAMNIRRYPIVELENPLSAEYEMARSWLTPSLLEFLSKNKHNRFPQMVFEAGEAVEIDMRTDTNARNARKLAAAITHDKATLSDVISVLNTLAENLGLSLLYKNQNHGSFIPGRSGIIIYKNQVIGSFGEAHPVVLDHWKLEKPVAAFEISLDEILKDRD